MTGQGTKAKEIRFRSINYHDGKVYPILASLTGYKHMNIRGERVQCAIYSINVDSWLAGLNRAVKLYIPTERVYGPFIVYEGPSPSGNGETVTIRLDDRSTYLARVKGDIHL